MIATIAREPDLGAVRTLGTRAIVVFVALLTGVALLTFIVAPPLFSLLEIPAESAAAVRSSVAAGTSNVQLPTFASWVVSLVPSNPIKAASDGAMLPLIVFAVFFAAALARSPAELRVPATAFFRAIAEAMLVIVADPRLRRSAVRAGRPLAVRLGGGVATQGFYLLSTAAAGGSGLLLYVVVRVASNVSGQFARALPAGAGRRGRRTSSVAALTAMIDGERACSVAGGV